MPNGVIIDGHLLPELSQELNSGYGELYEIWNWLIGNCGIAVSEEIEQFWENHCTKKTSKNHVFWTMYSQYLGTAIREIKPTILPKKCKDMLVKYGMPKDIFIMACLKTAKTTNYPKYILAEHISYHEPKASQDVKIKEKIITRRNGSVCKYLESIKIRVGDRKHCLSHFEIAKGNCTQLCISADSCPKSL